MTRIEKIQAKLRENGLDAIVLFSPVNIRYAVQFLVENGAVLVTSEGAWLLTDSRYVEAAQLKTVDAEVILFDTEHPLREKLKELLRGSIHIGAEERRMPYADWNRWQEILKCGLVPAENLILDLRSVKEPEEVANITAAQRIAERALEEVKNLIRPGVTERAIAAELTYRMMLYGGEGNSFDPIALTGKNTSVPHGVPSGAEVAEGDFVLMDFGCLVNGYCSDMTRTVAVGHATEEMRTVYETVLRAQSAGIACARCGVSGADIHNAAEKVIADAGYGARFGHAFGHSLGLEIHENPGAHPKNIKPMPAGVVISAEPGIYIPGKFGVRIEDMLRLTEDGNEDLTRAPKELEIL